MDSLRVRITPITKPFTYSTICIKELSRPKNPWYREVSGKSSKRGSAGLSVLGVRRAQTILPASKRTWHDLGLLEFFGADRTLDLPSTPLLMERSSGRRSSSAAMTSWVLAAWIHVGLGRETQFMSGFSQDDLPSNILGVHSVSCSLRDQPARYMVQRSDA